jgi:uncharacterized protein involved in outer membrane biogenesis
MRILKIFAILMAVGIALVIGVAFYASSKLDTYVKSTIEEYASQSLGSKVTVGEVNLSLRQTTATIANLVIANPPGFDGSHAFKASRIEIRLNPQESNLNSVVIEQVLLSQPSVHYLRTKETDNLSVLQKNAQEFTQSIKKEDAKDRLVKKENKQPRILIKKLDIEGADLVYQDMRVLGASVSLKLNDIHITNIDTGKDGVSTQQAVGKIIDAIISAVKEAATKSIADYLNIATDTLRNVTDTAQQYGKEAITNIKKFFQKN